MINKETILIDPDYGVLKIAYSGTLDNLWFVKDYIGLSVSSEYYDLLMRDGPENEYI